MKRGSEFLLTVVAAAVAVAVLLVPGVCSAAEKPARSAATLEKPLFPLQPSVKGMKLKVSPNGRYFVDQAGKPFFYLGDTCWLLFQRLGQGEVDEYLKDRAGKGFTVVQAYVLRGLGQRHPDGATSLLGESPLVDRDPTRPNEAFFQNVDYVVNRANELGLVMALVAAKSWHVNQHPERVFDARTAYAFGKFLGQRYKGNAVLWYVGGDSVPGGDREVWVAMARGLKDGSGGAHLVSCHGSGGTSSSTWFHKDPWLDFNSIQSGHGWGAKTYRFVSHDHGLAPAKPTVDMEPPYENHPTGARTPRIDAHQVRQGAYWALLAGAAGHGYGALDLFHLYKEDEGPFPRNGFQPWRKALAYEGARQVGLMRRLFEQRPWHRLLPDQSVIASGQGEGEQHIQAARATDGSFVIAYLPVGGSVGIHLDRLAGKNVKARWYDPRTGTWSEIGAYVNKGTREFMAPSRGPQSDWVLVLDAAAWQVGLAAVKITPQQPLMLSGYASRNRPFDKVTTDLYAKALALEDDDGHVAVLVTTDLLGLPAAIADPVRARLAKKTGLQDHQILLSSSHIHTGPALNSMTAGGAGTAPGDVQRTIAYTRELQDKLVEVVVSALMERQPARLSWGSGVANFVMNRRAWTPRGVVLGANPRGPADRTVPVLRIDGLDGKRLAVLFGAATHNTTLLPQCYEICGDYAGFAQAQVQVMHPGVQAMFLLGFAGDSDPYPRGTMDLARAHGAALGNEVDRVLETPLSPLHGPLKTAWGQADLPLKAPPAQEELVKQAAQKSGLQADSARQMLAALERGQKLPTQYSCPVAVWQFGTDMTLVALSGEVVVDYVALLEKALGPNRLWLAAYCNDVFGYVPSARVLAEGGYETRGLYAGGIGSFDPRAEEVLVQKVRELAGKAGRSLP